MAPTDERRKNEESYQEEFNRRPGYCARAVAAATAAMPPASPGVAEREKSRRVTVTKKEAEKRRKREKERARKRKKETWGNSETERRRERTGERKREERGVRCMALRCDH